MNEFSQFDAEESVSYSENYFERRHKEKTTLRKLSFLSGSAVLLYVFIQNFIVTILEGTGLLTLYSKNNFFQSGVDILLILLGILLPFTLVGRKMQKASGEAEPVLAEPVESKSLFIFGMFGCTGCVMLSNIVSSYITAFISLIGYELEAPDIKMPDGLGGFLVTMLKVCILTAVVEEYSLRGHILGNLRPYGDAFAIVMSAGIFALMHGNLVQVPFAMLSGIALGVFTIKSNSIWPAVVAHGINNGLSIVISYIIKIVGEEKGMLLYSYAMYILILVGIISCILFAVHSKALRLRKPQTVLSSGEKVTGFLFSLPTIAAFLIMVLITATSVK